MAVAQGLRPRPSLRHGGGEAELVRAHALVDRLWTSNDPADIVQLEAQARLIATYKERKWPAGRPAPPTSSAT